MADWGLTLANIVNNWQAASKQRQQEELLKQEMEAARLANEKAALTNEGLTLENQGYVSGDVAMATLFGGDPEQYQAWRGVKFSPRYLQNVGSFGESTAGIERTRGLLPYEQDVLGSQETENLAKANASNAQAGYYNTQGEAIKTDLANRIPLSSLMATAYGLNPDDPSLAPFAKITVDPAVSDSVAKALQSISATKTDELGRPYVLDKLRGEAQIPYATTDKIKAETGKVAEETNTERTLRPLRAGELASSADENSAQAAAARALANQRAADAAKSGGVPSTKDLTATQKRNRLIDNLLTAAHAWKNPSRDYVAELERHRAEIIARIGSQNYENLLDQIANIKVGKRFVPGSTNLWNKLIKHLGNAGLW